MSGKDCQHFLALDMHFLVTGDHSLYGVGLRVTGPNVALNCPATQYATWNTSVASMAVDGNPYSIACSLSTQNTHNPSWWSVDLGSSRFVVEVQVVNYQMISQERE